MTDVPVLQLDSMADASPDAAWRRVLEREALTPFLARQRWFAGKARTIARVRLADWSAGAMPMPVVLTIVDVDYDDGGSQRYFMPLAFVGEREGARTPAAVLARIDGLQGGVFVDALSDDGACRALLGALLDPRPIAMQQGTARPVPCGSERADAEGGRIERSAAEQSNSCVMFGRRYVLKLLRQLEQGPNPEVEIARFLLRGSFSNVPPLVSALEYEAPGAAGSSTSLALLQEFVPNTGTAWNQAVDDVRQFIGMDASAGAGAETPFLEAAATLGRRTAQLHAALASDDGDPDFRPEPLSPRGVASIVEDMERSAAGTLSLLEARMGSLPAGVRDKARAVLDGRAALADRIRSFAQGPAGSMRTRVHGDYHLGQVLSVGDDFVIIDFEGEPARSLAERRAKQSPLKDVAGMLRSFGYAAYAPLLAGQDARADDVERFEPRARLWEARASDAFLRRYRETVREANVVPADDRAFGQLLDAFVLEKALYELGYELASRPSWVGIPLIGILRILQPPDRPRA